MTEPSLPLLRNRPFRRLWAAQFSSMMAVYGLVLAGLVLVEDRTQSSMQTGLVLLSSVAPAFLGALVSGAIVDRWGPLRVLRASHLLRAALALGFWLALSLLPAGPGLVALYALNVAAVAVTQFAAPSEMSLLPDLLDHARLVSANGLLQLSLLAAEALGIVVFGPLLVKLAGAPAIGVAAAVLCLIAFGLVTTGPLGRVVSTHVAGQRGGLATLSSDIKAGWQAIARDRLLALVSVQATLAGVLLVVLLSLMPGLASRQLGLGAEDVPLLVLPGGVGFVAGIVLLSRVERRLSRISWITGGLAGLGTAIAVLALLSSQGGPARLWLFRGMTLGLGFALSLVVIPARAVLQERPPAEMRGRVIAAQLALANAAAVVPLVFIGLLADWLGIRPVMGLLALATVSIGAVGWFQARS